MPQNLDRAQLALELALVGGDVPAVEETRVRTPVWWGFFKQQKQRLVLVCCLVCGSVVF